MTINQVGSAGERGKVIGLQERRLGRTVLRTYRTKVDIDDIVPNEQQPRLGPKEDDELQRQIEANEGLFEPLLVEPHPDAAGQVPDHRRRAALDQFKVLVRAGREQYRQIPVEVTDRTLTDDERLRVWIYIHRQRKEWDAREKEMVAYRLVELVGTGGRRQHPRHQRARAGQAGRGLRAVGALQGPARSERRHHLGARADGRQQEAADADRRRRRRREGRAEAHHQFQGSAQAARDPARSRRARAFPERGGRS